jgi:chemotaxis protein methyltransferase CheR
MTLADAIGTLDFELYGTDISRRALHVAQRGVYAVETIAAVAEPLKLRWFMRSRNPSAKLVRVVPELRERASFAFANLTASHSRLGGPYDVIFLRNVLIYFDRDTQRKIIGQIVEHLKSKGWLFVGLSETADGLGLPLQRMGHSVYRRLT